MRKTIKAIVYETHGNPADVLQVKTEPWPKAAADEVVVEMRAAPINPADLNAIEGKYPARREVPAVPGFEGAGVALDLGGAHGGSGNVNPSVSSTCTTRRRCNRVVCV